jgi:hypothetical protein
MRTRQSAEADARKDASEPALAAELDTEESYMSMRSRQLERDFSLGRVVETDDRRRLNDIKTDEVFAYAVGRHDFRSASDFALWAHESDDVLLAARTGKPFARRYGTVFFDLESHLPIYYEVGTPSPDFTAPATSADRPSSAA